MDTNHSATSFIPKNVLGKLMHVSNQQLRQPSWKRWYPSCVQPSAFSARVNDGLSWEMARLAILAAGEELYILDVPILMKNTSIFDSQFCDGKMRKRLCRVCWIRKSWQQLCANARHWWKRLWNYRHLQPKPDIFHFLVIGGHFMQVNSDYGLKTSERYGSCKGQRRGPKSCVNSRQHHKKEADNIAALICKSIAGKADVCDIKRAKSLVTIFNLI